MAKREEEFEYLFKVLLIGDSGVGKSSLFSRFASNEFCFHCKPTIGINFATRTLQIGGDTVKAQLWDTAGQERFWSITSAYYRGALGIVLVYDVTNPSSFKSVRRWLDQIRYHGGSNVVTLLVGNKTDLELLRQVEKEDVAIFAEDQGLFFMETSALDATNVDSAFRMILSEVHSIARRKFLSSSADRRPTGDIRGKAITVLGSKANGTVSQCCSR